MLIHHHGALARHRPALQLRLKHSDRIRCPTYIDLIRKLVGYQLDAAHLLGVLEQVCVHHWASCRIELSLLTIPQLIEELGREHLGSCSEAGGILQWHVIDCRIKIEVIGAVRQSVHYVFRVDHFPAVCIQLRLQIFGGAES